MEMSGLSQGAEEPGQRQWGIGAGGLKLLELASKVEGVSGRYSKEAHGVGMGGTGSETSHPIPPPSSSPSPACDPFCLAGRGG